MECRMEHANMTVRSIDKAVHFLTAAFPEFQVRGSKKNSEDTRKKWLHIGTEKTYVALEEVNPPSETGRAPYENPGINHIGFVVDDLGGLIERLRSAGYDPGELAEDIDSRKRTYIFDENGVEWEFVQYLTDDPERANVYQ